MSDVWCLVSAYHPSMTEITIRPVTQDEYPAFVTAFMEGFSEDLPSETFPDLFGRMLPAERTLAAFDGNDIVGTFGGFDLDLTVPGGSTLRMEGTTVVTVFPTHRRQGLLKRMMDVHLDNAARAGFPLAGLWASETDIYGRFGYGIAAYNNNVEFNGTEIAFRPEAPVGRVRRITLDEAKESLPAVFDRVRTTRPGMYARSADWWDADVFPDEEWMRHGRTKKRYIVHDGPDGVDGYVIYRQKSDEAAAHANGSVAVIEMISESPEANASLWSFLASIDGCPNVRRWNTPIDDPLQSMVREPRRVRKTAIYDNLWVRILDVEAALSGRTYEEDGEITFSITDRFRPSTEGTYRLTVVDGVGTCESSDDPADLDMEIDVLGALLLGGADAHAYYAAGRITGDSTAVAVLHRTMRTVVAPWCDAVF